MKESKKSIVVNLSEEQTIIELTNILQPLKSEIFLKKNVQGAVYEINVKSILGLIGIQLSNGDEVEVRAEGEDAEDALQVIIDYLT